MFFTSSSTICAVRSEISRRCTTSRPRKISCSRSPTAIGPTTALIPNCVTIRRAMLVACWMSCAAPVVTFSGPNTSSSAARNDRHLVQGIGVGHGEPDQRMPRLVIGDQATLLVGEHAALPLEAEHHFVLRVLEVLHVDLRLVAARGEQQQVA